MSTRAHIRIQDGDEHLMLYHHSDGMPEGIGKDLRRFLANQCKDGYWDVEEIANALIKGAVKYWRKGIWSGKPELHTDDGYEVTTSLHGDEEYIYVIDCESKSIKCYTHKMDYPYHLSVVPENEVEIPEPKAEEA